MAGARNAARRAERQADPSATREKDRARYARDKDRIKARRAAYVERNRAAVRVGCSDYYYRNREKRIAAVIERAARNPERTREYARRATRKARLDPTKRLSDAVSAYMNYSLRGGKAGAKWLEIADYTLEDLVRHLERQFRKGMTWENYGRNGWHVDHIIPVSSFDFTSPSDPAFWACWALSNLRPMWASDNIRKGARRLTLL